MTGGSTEATDESPPGRAVSPLARRCRTVIPYKAVVSASAAMQQASADRYPVRTDRRLGCSAAVLFQTGFILRGGVVVDERRIIRIHAGNCESSNTEAAKVDCSEGHFQVISPGLQASRPHVRMHLCVSVLVEGNPSRAMGTNVANSSAAECEVFTFPPIQPRWARMVSCGSPALWRTGRRRRNFGIRCLFD